MKKNYLLNADSLIVSEWHPTLNGTDKPEQYTIGSHKSVWWLGKCGHEWKAPIKSRITYKTGCPYCSGNKVLKGFNDLATVYPELAKEWHPNLNGDLCPDDIMAGSSKKVFWLCKNGHYWDASVSSRISGRGCRYCSGNAVWRGYNDLKFVSPELAEEWHPILNGELTSEDVTYGSNKCVWWLGKCGHEWQESIKLRSNGQKCPYCSGKEVLKGFNDIVSLFPYLEKEWDYEKNKPFLPEMFTKGCDKKFYWICQMGHNYEMNIASRTAGQNCPVCASESKTSFPEQAFFYYISGIFPDAINRDISLGMELDIYIPSIRTAIEYDGDRWHNDGKKEHIKNVKCFSKKIRLIRIKENNIVLEDENVNYIYRKDKRSTLSLNEVIKEALYLLGVTEDIIVDVDKDRNEIYALFVKSIKKNNFAQQFPELIKEWNYEKNGNMLPENFAAYSNRKVWWIGECGHEWEAKVEERAYGRGCPICVGKKIRVGENDLATNYPELVAEWNIEKNDNLNPMEVSAGSTKKVWWIGKCGHEWTAIISDRVKGSGCPVCDGKKVEQGFNDLLTLKPAIAKQWDYEKNTIGPESVTIYSGKKVWWKCNKGHSYETKISQKTLMGTNCPICSNRVIVTGINDLITECPFVTKEWDYKKNENIFPQKYNKGSGKSVYWICTVCNYSYKREIRNHVQENAKCPKCKQLLLQIRNNYGGKTV